MRLRYGAQLLVAGQAESLPEQQGSQEPAASLCRVIDHPVNKRGCKSADTPNREREREE